jgi:hypothetical protein
MEKKTIYYIIGGVAILGIGYYLMNKGKKPTDKKETDTEDNSMALDSMTLDNKAVDKSEIKAIPVKLPPSLTPTATKPAPKKLTPQELESKLQSACGKKPLTKKNKIKYEQCRTDLTAKLKGQGLVSFDGSYSLENNVFGAGFYSNFENNLDLDL